MGGLTLDTGALIALERRAGRMPKIWAVATAEDARITVPTVVVGEWWRGQRGPIAKILDAVEVEPLSLEIAKAAGAAMARVAGAGLADAIVMASAARRGDLVYTSDIEDLQRLQQPFPSVRLVRV